jgi:hypothetical protein
LDCSDRVAAHVYTGEVGLLPAVVRLQVAFDVFDSVAYSRNSTP